MKWPTLSISLISLFLAGCGNLYQGIYEGNKNYKESGKSPGERAMTPTPSYGTYQKDRGNLKQDDVATDKKDSPDFSLK